MIANRVTGSCSPRLRAGAAPAAVRIVRYVAGPSAMAVDVIAAEIRATVHTSRTGLGITRMPVARDAEQRTIEVAPPAWA
jgi:hypothetical protein